MGMYIYQRTHVQMDENNSPFPLMSARLGATYCVGCEEDIDLAASPVRLGQSGQGGEVLFLRLNLDISTFV